MLTSASAPHPSATWRIGAYRALPGSVTGCIDKAHTHPEAPGVRELRERLADMALLATITKHSAASFERQESLMPAANSPMRIDADLAASARSTAKTMSRSLSQQIAHWARIGRELERSPGVTVTAVLGVLDGNAGYDDLNVQEQAVVRAEWAERIDKTRSELRLDRLLAEQGREVVELDADGAVVVRNPGRGRPKRVAR